MYHWEDASDTKIGPNSHRQRSCSLVDPWRLLFAPTIFNAVAIVDPAAELEAMLRADPARGDAPLFRDPATGQPISVAQVRSVVKAIAYACGLAPENFGAHSLRCATATSLA